jgi:hypothetical protein
LDVPNSRAAVSSTSRSQIFVISLLFKNYLSSPTFEGDQVQPV